MQAVLKFPAPVTHVSSVTCHDVAEASVLICCLSDSQVLAFSVENLIKKYVPHSTAKMMGREERNCFIITVSCTHTCK